MNTEERLRELGEWVVATCVLFGATLETAYIVAGHFVKGLRAEWAVREKRDAG